MNKNKKLLYFASSKRIGLTYHLTIASKYFSKIKGIDYTLVSGDREQFEGLFKTLQNNGIKYKTFAGIDEIENFFKNIIPFLKWVKIEKFDVIHAQTNTHLIYGIVSKILFNIKIIYTIHSYRNSNLCQSIIMTLWLSLVLNIFGDKVITLSTLVQKHFRRFFLKSEFLTLGFENAHRRINISTDAINIIYPAKFHKAKGHNWLIEALIPLIKRNSDLTVFLPGDGEMLNCCKEKVKSQGLTNKILFPGWLDKKQLNSYMSRANLAVVPSKSENGGHCIVEPLFYGLPIISTPVGIAPDAIKDGYNGFFISYKNKNALQEKILYFYQNRIKLKEFGERSYKIAQNNLTWQTIAKKYARLLSQI